MPTEFSDADIGKPVHNYVYRAVAALGICTAIGLIFAFMGSSVRNQPNNIGQTRQFRSQATQDSIFEKLINNVDPDKIKENLRALTQSPHPAGTSANYKVADKIAEIWRTNGLEDVHFVKYRVLLSYPNYSNPNQVSILMAQAKQFSSRRS
uniref:Uncharacterized protein n=1 Tax=Ditylenchus dipsaci TaxID=166011 RepID=A0A915CLJ5_9BILA